MGVYFSGVVPIARWPHNGYKVINERILWFYNYTPQRIQPTIFKSRLGEALKCRENTWTSLLPFLKEFSCLVSEVVIVLFRDEEGVLTQSSRVCTFWLETSSVMCCFNTAIWAVLGKHTLSLYGGPVRLSRLCFLALSQQERRSWPHVEGVSSYLCSLSFSCLFSSCLSTIGIVSVPLWEMWRPPSQRKVGLLA